MFVLLLSVICFQIEFNDTFLFTLLNIVLFHTVPIHLVRNPNDLYNILYKIFVMNKH